MQTLEPAVSRLSPIGYSNNSCGYCNNQSGSQSHKRFSYYASTSSLTVEFYQSLLNRGWRRSGTLLYKPDLRESCCPQYTIRLDSQIFHASKDQRQCQNRFNKHVIGDVYTKEAARLYPRSREQARKRTTHFSLVDRVHESEAEQLESLPGPEHKLIVTLEPNHFTEEKYVVFENYQRIVHHEPPRRISKSGFQNFLCKSPLSETKKLFDGKERRLGSYHQCYRLDGKLVAVGVLDLLPQCVSAVYFMYDESVHQHGFGKIGALREIALAKEEGYRFWYAGFYIHNCVKMRYKGDFSPQYILDPESYEWDLLNDSVKLKLDSNKYLSLSRDRTNIACANTATLTPDPGTSTDPNSSQENKDSDYDPPVLDAEIPLFKRNMPGLLTSQELLTEVDLDCIRLRVREQDAITKDLVGWKDADMCEPNSVKGIIAELVAAVGKRLAQEMVVTFD